MTPAERDRDLDALRGRLAAEIKRLWRRKTLRRYRVVREDWLSDARPLICQIRALDAAIRALSPPRIAAAAILSDGVIYSLPPPARHHNVMAMLGVTTLGSVEKYALHDGEQGFVDDAGHYLTRSQAYEVAKAAEQLIPRAGGYAKGEVNAGPDLFSEDLW